MKNHKNNFRYKAVIYDCDGVMFDSFEANYSFYNRILLKMGKTPLDRADREMMRILHTFASKEVLRYIFPDDKNWSDAMVCASAIDYRELVPQMVMEDGFLETLERLSGQIGLAVCTNRSGSIDAVLDSFRLNDCFDIVISAAKVAYPKPHPEPLIKILEFFRIDPDEALFVGDSMLDYQSAASARVPFVSYKSDLPGFARIENHLEIFNLLLTSSGRLSFATP